MQTKTLALASLMFIAPRTLISGAELRTCTLQAWDAYLVAARSRMDERLNGAKPFLWVQESQEHVRFVRSGSIPVEPSDGNGHTAVAGGLIHDWTGAVFVPGVTAEQVWAKLGDFEEYRSFYQPTVIDSRLLSRDGETRRFSMRWSKGVSLATSVVDADYEASYSRPRPDRWWSLTRSTRIQEVAHFGQVDERLQPIGVGAGYVWRLYSITRAMELDGGVVIELEAVVLSRDIPASVAWLVEPIVNRVSRNSLLTTLRQTREAVGRGGCALVAGERH